MTAVYLDAVSVLAPGLAGWSESRPVLTGACPYARQALPAFPKDLLARNERRRATRVMKLVLQVAASIAAEASYKPETVHSVFASSAGDSEIMDKICSVLTLPERPVSPTQFHNSVHNAPAGYWSISTGCRKPSTSLSAHDGSFAAGLLEAAATVVTEQAAVLLIAYDYPLPPPLHAIRPMLEPFAAALLLAPGPPARNGTRLTLRLTRDAAESSLTDPALERLRLGNPAARSLPLLQTLAGRQDGVRLFLPYIDASQLQVDMQAGGA